MSRRGSDAPSVDDFVARVRRRLRLAWGVDVGELVLPALGLGALLLVVVGRLRPWTWPEPTALALAVLVVVALLGAALMMRIPDLVVARAADRGLSTRDALATALERRSDPEGPGRFDALVQQRAERVVVVHDPHEAVPVRARWGWWAVAALLAAGAVTLAVAHNPQDDVRRQREREAAQIESEAERLREEAAALRADPAATDEERALADRLEQLARDLEQASSMTEAQALLRQAESELQAATNPNGLAEKAAAQGLDRALEQRPLPGASGGDAAAQLDQAAASLPALSAEQREELARRLDALAGTQTAGNPELASELRDAAEAVRSGDDDAAADSLSAAGDAQRRARSSARADGARSGAASSVAGARDRLARGESGESDGDGDGQGQGQDGQGQDGQGQDGQDGQGGQGQGQGGQGGAASGQVGGAQGGTGGSATGGPGTPDGSGHSTGDPDEKANHVYDPAGATDGEQLQADGTPTGDGTEIGKQQGPNTAGDARVPLSQGLPRYTQEAARALDQSDLPPSLQALVRQYFERLGQR